MKSKHILAVIIAVGASAAMYSQTAEAVYQCKGGSRNVSNGVCRSMIYDDGERCPGNKPSTFCFGFEIAPDGGGASPGDVAISGDAATSLADGPRQPLAQAVPVRDAVGPRQIPVGEVSARSPSINLSKIGTQVAPGIFQVDPAALAGRRLIIDLESRVAIDGVCIGVYSKKRQSCYGIWIGFK